MGSDHRPIIFEYKMLRETGGEELRRPGVCRIKRARMANMDGVMLEEKRDELSAKVASQKKRPRRRSADFDGMSTDLRRCQVLHCGKM